MHIRRHEINIENLSSLLSNLIFEAECLSQIRCPTTRLVLLVPFAGLHHPLFEAGIIANRHATLDSSDLSPSPLYCTVTLLMTEPSPSPVPSYFNQTEIFFVSVTRSNSYPYFKTFLADYFTVYNKLYLLKQLSKQTNEQAKSFQKIKLGKISKSCCGALDWLFVFCSCVSTQTMPLSPHCPLSPSFGFGLAQLNLGL